MYLSSTDVEFFNEVIRSLSGTHRQDLRQTGEASQGDLCLF